MQFGGRRAPVATVEQRAATVSSFVQEGPATRRFLNRTRTITPDEVRLARPFSRSPHWIPFSRDRVTTEARRRPGRLSGVARLTRFGAGRPSSSAFAFARYGRAQARLHANRTRLPGIDSYYARGLTVPHLQCNDGPIFEY